MGHRVFVIATILSTVLLALTVLMFTGSICIDELDAYEHHLSITNNFHVGFCDGFVAFFNKPEGPYVGGVICLSGGSGYTRMDKAGFGRTLGIYYRYFRFWDSGEIVWTLMVSLVYPAAIFSILPVTWLWRRWRRVRRLPTGSTVEGDDAC